MRTRPMVRGRRQSGPIARRANGGQTQTVQPVVVGHNPQVWTPQQNAGYGFPLIPAPHAISPTDGTERARQDIAQTFAEHDIMANVSRFVGLSILPGLTMQLAHGTYPHLTIKQLLKRRATAATAALGEAGARAPGGGYHRDTLSFTQENYSTKERGFEGIIDENEMHVYRDHFEHETTTARATYRDVLLEQEIKIANTLFSQTTFVPNAALGHSQDAGTYNRANRAIVNPAGAVAWSDVANSRPVEDVWVAKRKVFDRTGVRADCMVINEETFELLRFNDQIRDTWMASGAGSRAAQRDVAVFDNAANSPSHMESAASAIAFVLDIEELVVGSAYLDGNADPAGAFQLSEVWTDKALVFVKSSPGVEGLRAPSLGHTFIYADDVSESNTLVRNNFGLGGATGVHVESYWDDRIRAEVIRVRHQYGLVIKHVDCGELINNVL